MRELPSACVLAACLCLDGAANAAVDVGWVETVTSQPAMAFIQRGPDRLRVTQFQTLREGDVLSATGDARIEIRLGEGSEIVKVNSSNSPFVVARGGEVPGAWSKMLDWLREVVRQKIGKGQPEEERLAIAATRSMGPTVEPLDFPTFPQPEYFLFAGQRDFHFVWRGGVAPYSVRLTNKKTGTLIAQQPSAAGNEALLKAVNIEPGTYLLRVTDSSNASRLLRLSAVESKAGPKHAGSVNTVGLTATQRAFFDAAWLAGQSNQAWLLEAYQQLFDIDLPEATFLRDVIAQGCPLPAVRP